MAPRVVTTVHPAMWIDLCETRSGDGVVGSEAGEVEVYHSLVVWGTPPLREVCVEGDCAEAEPGAEAAAIVKSFGARIRRE